MAALKDEVAKLSTLGSIGNLEPNMNRKVLPMFAELQVVVEHVIEEIDVTLVLASKSAVKNEVKRVRLNIGKKEEEGG